MIIYLIAISLKSATEPKMKCPLPPYVNRYDITSYKYNTYRIPMLNLGYNVEDNVLIGVGFSLKTFGFQKRSLRYLSKTFNLIQLLVQKHTS